MAACVRASSAGGGAPWSPSVTRFGPEQPVERMTYVVCPVSWIRTPKPGRSPRSEDGILRADGERIDRAPGRAPRYRQP